MAKLERVHQKIFASNAPASDVGVIGSLHEGNPTEAASVQDIQSLAAFEAGIRSIVIGENSPIIEEDNALYKLITYQLAYLFQNGIPEWDSLVEYHPLSMIKHGANYYFLPSGTSENQEPGVSGAWETFYPSANLMPLKTIPVNRLRKNFIENDTIPGTPAFGTSISFPISVPMFQSGATVFGVIGRGYGAFSFKMEYRKTVENGDFVLLVKNSSNVIVSRTTLSCPEANVTYSVSSIEIGFDYDQSHQWDTDETYTLSVDLENEEAIGVYSFSITGPGSFYAKKVII